MIMANFEVHRVLANQGRSANIVFVSAFGKLSTPEQMIRPFGSNLVGFAKKKMRVKGYVELLATFAKTRIILV